MAIVEGKSYSTFDIRLLEAIRLDFQNITTILPIKGCEKEIDEIKANVQDLKKSLEDLWLPTTDQEQVGRYINTCRIAADIAGSLTQLIKNGNFTIAQTEFLTPMSITANDFCEKIGKKLEVNDSRIEQFYEFKKEVDMRLGRKAPVIVSGKRPYENLKTQDFEAINAALRECLEVAKNLLEQESGGNVILDKVIKRVSDKRRQIRHSEDSHNKSVRLMSAARDILHVRKAMVDCEAFTQSTHEEQEAMQKPFHMLESLVAVQTTAQKNRNR